jgi:hypothetical protein
MSVDVMKQALDAQRSEGMTLRDYFAAKAMPVAMQELWAQATRSGHSHDGPVLIGAATLAYEVADAMLEAREA